MKNFFKNYKTFFIVLGVVIVVGGIYLLTQSGASKVKTEVFEVKSENLVQSIEASGSIEPATAIDLTFKKTAQITDIQVETGSRVKKGDLLANVENQKESAALAQNRALLIEAQANLNLKRAKATKEDIDISRSAVQQSIANQNKATVDFNNNKVDYENTKKIVAQDISSAELELQNAKLNLSRVQVTTSSSTNQNSSVLNNAAIAYKSSLGQFLISVKSNLQSIDKIFGLEGASVFDGKSNVNVNTSAQTYVRAREVYVQSLTNYGELKKIYDSLPATADIEILKGLYQKTDSLIQTVNNGTLATSSVLDEIIPGIDFSFSDLSQLRNEITSSGNSVNSGITAYNSAKKSFDDALLNQTNTTGTTPLDLETAQLAVTQKEQNLTKVKVNSEIQVSNKKADMDAAQAQLQVQKSLVQQANAGLQKTLADPRAVDLAPYQARISQAQAQIMNAENDFNNTLLKAPFDGIVSAKNVEVGEQSSSASAGTTTGSSGSSKAAFSLIDDSKFHIDVNIPETQVNRIGLDSKVEITFDAVGDDKFEGKILSIEPAAQNIQDSVYYRAKITLVKNDPRLRSDMTANVLITSEKTKTSLVIPEKAITLLNGIKTVQVEGTANEKPQTVNVVTGSRGKDGLIEIISGLKTGQKVIVQVS